MNKVNIEIIYVDGTSFTARNCVSDTFGSLPKDKTTYHEFQYEKKVEGKVLKIERFVLKTANIRAIIKSRNATKQIWVNPSVSSTVKISITKPITAQDVQKELAVKATEKKPAPKTNSVLRGKETKNTDKVSKPKKAKAIEVKVK